MTSFGPPLQKSALHTLSLGTKYEPPRLEWEKTISIIKTNPKEQAFSLVSKLPQTPYALCECELPIDNITMF